MKHFKNKLERDTWIQKASDADVVEYFEQRKPALLSVARKTMTDAEIIEWCRLVADFTVAGQEI